MGKPCKKKENHTTKIRTRRIGANPEKSDLVTFRGPDWRKFSELCVLLFFLRKTDKMLPKSQFSKPIFGQSAGSTKLDRPYCKRFWKKKQGKRQKKNKTRIGAHLKPRFRAGFGLFSTGFALFPHFLLFSAGFAILECRFCSFKRWLCSKKGTQRIHWDSQQILSELSLETC